MARLLLILALVGTAFWVYSIVDCALQPPTRHRGVSKGAWIAIVVLLPVLGGLLWFVVGRGRASTAAARRAPDDDPEFLGSIGSIADQDERIRRLRSAEHTSELQSLMRHSYDVLCLKKKTTAQYHLTNKTHNT